MGELDLAARVHDALQEAGIGGKVSVEQTTIPGVVKLIGRVVSEDERLRADQAARSLDDVLDVIDEIALGASRPVH